MDELKGYQKKFLKGLAHGFKPVVFIGQKGLTATLIESMREALETHELIKVKFVDFKDRQQKAAMAETVASKAGCQMVGMIGHIAIFYRRQADPEKRKIDLPQR
jgi:RNA-binding protein